MGARDDEDDAWWLRLDRSIGGRMLHVTTPRSFAILRCGAKIKTMGNMGASLHAPKKKPVVQERVWDEPGVKHRIKPKDEAWDEGH